jgi:hypothetical protein
MNDDANRGSWQLVEAVGVFTAVVAQAAYWLDIAAMMDGPGTGFGDRVLSSSLCGASVLALCFPLAARFYKAGGICGEATAARSTGDCRRAPRRAPDRKPRPPGLDAGTLHRLKVPRFAGLAQW